MVEKITDGHFFKTTMNPDKFRQFFQNKVIFSFKNDKTDQKPINTDQNRQKTDKN